MLSLIWEVNIPDTDIIKSSAYVVIFTPLLFNMRTISYITINQSTGVMAPPWDVPLLTILAKWLLPRLDWIILLLALLLFNV